MKKVVSAFQSLRVRVLTGTAVLGLVAFVFAANVDARSTFDRAKDWASMHHAVMSGLSLEEFAAYPEEYQKAMLKEMSGVDHSRLWQTQFALVLKNEKLNAAQRAFVLQTMAQATPESFEPNAPHPEICADIKTLFPDEHVRRAMVTLGAEVAPVSTWRPFVIAATERVRGALVADADIEYCNCRGLGLCECGLFEGCQDVPGCQQTGQCGCVWLGDCDQKECLSGIIMDSATTKPGSVIK